MSITLKLGNQDDELVKANPSGKIFRSGDYLVWFRAEQRPDTSSCLNCYIYDLVSKRTTRINDQRQPRDKEIHYNSIILSGPYEELDTEITS